MIKDKAAVGFSIHENGFLELQIRSVEGNFLNISNPSAEKALKDLKKFNAIEFKKGYELCKQSELILRSCIETIELGTG